MFDYVVPIVTVKVFNCLMETRVWSSKRELD